MAYRYLARNQSIPQQIVMALQGKRPDGSPLQSATLPLGQVSQYQTLITLLWYCVIYCNNNMVGVYMEKNTFTKNKFKFQTLVDTKIYHINSMVFHWESIYFWTLEQYKL